MSRHKRAEFAKIRTISISKRRSKVSLAEFAAPFRERTDAFSQFVDGFPALLKAEELKDLVRTVGRARRGGKPVILMMGAHVVKVGLSPVVIDLLEGGVLTAIAMNSATAIHDVEAAMWGTTSEDVEANLLDGSFGMARETGELINGVLAREARTSDLGYGEALGNVLIERKAKFRKVSILATCARLSIPATVHAAIGADIIHQHPTMDGGATGEMSFRDFRTLCETCRGLGRGSVVLNVGSAVIMPEVFLKALTVARNLGATARGFTTAVFDMNMLYRPAMNVQLRPTRDGGKGYYFTGHHEIMIPLMAAMIKRELSGWMKRRS